jgi:hypothetical protein
MGIVVQREYRISTKDRPAVELRNITHNIPNLEQQNEQLKMIFVCGCGHSGTSLIAAMLGAHQSIYAINEETYLFAAKNINSMNLSGSEIMRIFSEKYFPAARLKRASFVCEKTPIHVYYLNRMRSVFPGSSIFIPVRDPRDVALSIKLRTGNLREGYLRWLNDNAVVAKEIAVRSKDIFVFRYEDFIADPIAHLKRVCAHIPIGYDQNMLQYHRDPRPWFGAIGATGEQSPTPDKHVEFRNWQIKQPILDRRGRWKTLLTKDEVAEVEGACSNMMKIFGYEH